MKTALPLEYTEGEDLLDHTDLHCRLHQTIPPARPSVHLQKDCEGKEYLLVHIIMKLLQSGSNFYCVTIQNSL